MAQLASRCALSEIVEIASLLLHEFGHMLGPYSHCSEISFSRWGGCCMYLMEYQFRNYVYAKLGLPYSIMKDWTYGTEKPPSQEEEDDPDPTEPELSVVGRRAQYRLMPGYGPWTCCFLSGCGDAVSQLSSACPAWTDTVTPFTDTPSIPGTMNVSIIGAHESLLGIEHTVTVTQQWPAECSGPDESPGMIQREVTYFAGPEEPDIYRDPCAQRCSGEARSLPMDDPNSLKEFSRCLNECNNAGEEREPPNPDDVEGPDQQTGRANP